MSIPHPLRTSGLMKTTITILIYGKKHFQLEFVQNDMFTIIQIRKLKIYAQSIT